MTSYKDLNPKVQQIISDMTDGLDLMEASRLRQIAINRIEKAAEPFGIILPSTVAAICMEILQEDLERIDAAIASLS